MLCERCQENEAEIHIKSMINGQFSEHHLCRSCATQLQAAGWLPEMKLSFSVGNLLGSFLEQVQVPPLESASKEIQKTCPRCGLSYEEFRKSGKMGCAACYEAFKDEIRPLLRTIHGSEVHRGLRPVFWEESPQTQVRSDLEELKAALRDALEKEEYERAAELRDRIRALEKRGNPDEG